MSKLGSCNNKSVTLNVLYSIALPTLTYAIEALCLNKSEILSLDHPWTRAFQKLFKTFDKNVVKDCQWYNGYLDIEHYHAIKSLKFLLNLEFSPNDIVKKLFTLCAIDDIKRMSVKFNCCSNGVPNDYKQSIVKHFQDNCYTVYD